MDTIDLEDSSYDGEEEEFNSDGFSDPESDDLLYEGTSMDKYPALNASTNESTNIKGVRGNLRMPMKPRSSKLYKSLKRKWMKWLKNGNLRMKRRRDLYTAVSALKRRNEVFNEQQFPVQQSLKQLDSEKTIYTQQSLLETEIHDIRRSESVVDIDDSDDETEKDGVNLSAVPSHSEGFTLSNVMPDFNESLEREKEYHRDVKQLQKGGSVSCELNIIAKEPIESRIHSEADTLRQGRDPLATAVQEIATTDMDATNSEIDQTIKPSHAIANTQDLAMPSSKALDSEPMINPEVIKTPIIPNDFKESYEKFVQLARKSYPGQCETITECNEHAKMLNQRIKAIDCLIKEKEKDYERDIYAIMIKQHMLDKLISCREALICDSSPKNYSKNALKDVRDCLTLLRKQQSTERKLGSHDTKIPNSEIILRYAEAPTIAKEMESTHLPKSFTMKDVEKIDAHLCQSYVKQNNDLLNKQREAHKKVVNIIGHSRMNKMYDFTNGAYKKRISAIEMPSNIFNRGIGGIDTSKTDWYINRTVDQNAIGTSVFRRPMNKLSLPPNERRGEQTDFDDDVSFKEKTSRYFSFRSPSHCNAVTNGRRDETELPLYGYCQECNVKEAKVACEYCCYEFYCGDDCLTKAWYNKHSKLCPSVEQN